MMINVDFSLFAFDSMNVSCSLSYGEGDWCWFGFGLWRNGLASSRVWLSMPDKFTECMLSLRSLFVVCSVSSGWWVGVVWLGGVDKMILARLFWG